MLVLSRKPDQSIVIDDKIVIKINSVHGQTVSVGISAPPDVLIVRSELLAACESENPPSTDE